MEKRQTPRRYVDAWRLVVAGAKGRYFDILEVMIEVCGFALVQGVGRGIAFISVQKICSVVLLSCVY